jgi:hypothetical protein
MIVGCSRGSIRPTTRTIGSAIGGCTSAPSSVGATSHCGSRQTPRARGACRRPADRAGSGFSDLAIEGARPSIPLRGIVRFLQLSPSRRQRACALNDQRSCPRMSPHRLTRGEVHAIEDMVTSLASRHVPTRTRAVLTLAARCAANRPEGCESFGKIVTPSRTSLEHHGRLRTTLDEWWRRRESKRFR